MRWCSMRLQHRASEVITTESLPMDGSNRSGHLRQRKPARPVRFELTEVTRQPVDDYLRASGLMPGQCLFSGHFGTDRPLTTRQYARLVSQWGIGLDPLQYTTHSMYRTKATLIYRRIGNLRAVQLLLGHLRIESTVRYLGAGTLWRSQKRSSSEIPRQSCRALPSSALPVLPVGECQQETHAPQQICCPPTMRVLRGAR